MNSFSQLRRQAFDKQVNSEFHPTRRNQPSFVGMGKLENEKPGQSKLSLKQNTIFETLDSQLGLDILKEITVKNKILSAQLEEYKLLVANMEKKIGELKQQNFELNQKISVLGKSMEADNEIEEDGSQLFGKTIPVHKLLSQAKEKETSISCQSVKKIIGKLELNVYQISSSKVQIQKYLTKMVEEKQELQNFVQNLWELKDRIEPGGQQFLHQLWKWIKMIGVNYLQLRQYKKGATKEQKLSKKDKY